MKKYMMAVVLAALSVHFVASGEQRISALEFSIESGYYKDKGKWLAVNPAKDKSGSASLVFPFRDGTFDVTLEMVGENDGQSKYEILIEKSSLGNCEAPLSTKTYEEGPGYFKVFKDVKIGDGDIITVKSTIGSADGKEWSRARWAAIRIKPVDGKAALAKLDKPAANAAALPPLYGKRMPDGSGAVDISGELKQWHNVVLTLDGPFAHELDNKPNPFIDRRMDVVFTHESGEPEYLVPGYFAADGNAGESSARSGTKWRAHLSPDKTGKWSYKVVFKDTAFDGRSGSFAIGATDKSGCDLRSKGRLEYVGRRYQRFAGNGEWFLKVGADAPETLLAYADFDDPETADRGKCPLKSWSPHVKDWKPGDPTWKNGKGKGLIGAVSYLSAKGCNAFSFLPYNAGGDGDNVWPHVSRDDKLHFDCSRLDQWGVVFNHGTAKGMYLHFKLQETENDDLRGKGKGIQHALDDGDLGLERKAYLREMIARFGHNLALNWNIGEENTQSYQQIDDMARFIRETDPYGHNVVLHTYPNQQDQVYGPFLGKKERLTGVSIQNSDVADSHRDALKWVTRSEAAGHPWITALDEAGNAGAGTPPDPDWTGMKEALQKIDKKLKVPSIDDVRAEVLWGTLMAGGAGVEYYFGYRFPESDLNCEDWRSREKTWDYSRYAINFFRDEKIPFWEMTNSNALIGNKDNNNSGYCLSKSGKVYVVYLRQFADVKLDLTGASGTYTVQWFNPRAGGKLVGGSVSQVKGGSAVSIGKPPADPDQDWVAVIRL